jgi:hypothetical protein
LVRNVHNKKVYAMKLLDKSELVYWYLLLREKNALF